MKSDNYHVPVLLHESMEGLNIKRDGIYVDVTLGGGGHSREIMSYLGANGRLYSFDQDADAINECLSHREHMQDESTANWTLIRSNFRYLKNWMRYYDVEGIDGLLADLGVSSHHFDVAERGFSFRSDAPLDMRMNQEGGRSAADVVNGEDGAALVSTQDCHGLVVEPRYHARLPLSAHLGDVQLLFFDEVVGGLALADSANYQLVLGVRIVERGFCARYLVDVLLEVLGGNLHALPLVVGIIDAALGEVKAALLLVKIDVLRHRQLTAKRQQCQ